MVYKVDGDPQLDTCDWSMYWNILKILFGESSQAYSTIRTTIWKLGLNFASLRFDGRFNHQMVLSLLRKC